MTNERINEEGVILDEIHIEEMEEIVAPGWISNGWSKSILEIERNQIKLNLTSDKYTRLFVTMTQSLIMLRSCSLHG